MTFLCLTLFFPSPRTYFQAGQIHVHVNEVASVKGYLFHGIWGPSRDRQPVMGFLWSMCIARYQRIKS